MQRPSKNRIIMRETISQSTTPVETISRKAAVSSLAAAALFLVLLAVLHVIKPEFDPSWRFVSEYAIGDYGWIMTMAFTFLGISCASLVMAIRSHVNTTGGKLGLILLLVVAASLLAAGVFVADPITATSEQLTMHGTLHGVAAMIGIPGLPIAAVLITRSLVRNPSWFLAKRWLRWTAHLTWISVVIMFASMFIMLGRTQGKFGPDVLIGWPNRLVVLAYCAWLIAVDWRAVQFSQKLFGIRNREKASA
jgi:hypothetical protein